MATILCDYCDAAATMFFPRSAPRERSFACSQHAERAQGAVGAHDHAVSGVLPDRPRFEELDLVGMLARWRDHRQTTAKAS